MFFSKKHVNHCLCSNCNLPFPVSWTTNGKGRREGKEVFCSPFCYETYLDHTAPTPRGLHIILIPPGSIHCDRLYGFSFASPQVQ